MNGEYGYKDIYLGVPMILGKNGVGKDVVLDFDDDDKERFKVSYNEVWESLRRIVFYANI